MSKGGTHIIKLPNRNTISQGDNISTWCRFWQRGLIVSKNSEIDTTTESVNHSLSGDFPLKDGVSTMRRERSLKSQEGGNQMSRTHRT